MNGPNQCQQNEWKRSTSRLISARFQDIRVKGKILRFPEKTHSHTNVQEPEWHQISQQYCGNLGNPGPKQSLLWTFRWLIGLVIEQLRTDSDGPFCVCVVHFFDPRVGPYINSNFILLEFAKGWHVVFTSQTILDQGCLPGLPLGE